MSATDELLDPPERYRGYARELSDLRRHHEITEQSLLLSIERVD